MHAEAQLRIEETARTGGVNCDGARDGERDGERESTGDGMEAASRARKEAYEEHATAIDAHVAAVHAAREEADEAHAARLDAEAAKAETEAALAARTADLERAERAAAASAAEAQRLRDAAAAHGAEIAAAAEATIDREMSLSHREAECTSREAETQTHESEVQARMASLALEQAVLADREASIGGRESALVAAEAAAEAVAEHEADVMAREVLVTARESDVVAREAEMSAREAEVAAREEAATDAATASTAATAAAAVASQGAGLEYAIAAGAAQQEAAEAREEAAVAHAAAAAHMEELESLRQLSDVTKEELETLRREKATVERSAAHALEVAQRAAAARDEDVRSERLSAERDRNALVLELNETRRRLATCEHAAEGLRASLVASRAALAVAPPTPAAGSGANGRATALVAAGSGAAGAVLTAGSPGSAKRLRCRQSPRVISRVVELGLANAPISEIDAALSHEGHTTSTGTPWPAKNDGRVVTRLLLKHGLQPNFGNDHRLAEYARQYGARMAPDMSPQPALLRHSSGPAALTTAAAGVPLLEARANSLPVASAPVANDTVLQPLNRSRTGGTSGAKSTPGRTKSHEAREHIKEQIPPNRSSSAPASNRSSSVGGGSDDSARISDISEEWEWERREEMAVRARTAAWWRRQQREASAAACCGRDELDEASQEESTEEPDEDNDDDDDDSSEGGVGHRGQRLGSVSSQGSLSQPGHFLGDVPAARSQGESSSQGEEFSQQFEAGSPPLDDGRVDGDGDGEDDDDDDDESASDDDTNNADMDMLAHEGLSTRSEPLAGDEPRAPLSRLTKGGVGSPRHLTRRQRRARGQPVELCAGAVPRNLKARRPTEPPWCSLSEARTTVGRRVRIYWGGDKCWYAGRIVLVHPTSLQVFIKYDDHDERWHAMWEEMWEWEDGGEGAAALGNGERRLSARREQKRIGPRPRSSSNPPVEVQ